MFEDLNHGFLHLSPALVSKYSKFLSQFKPHDIVKRLHEAEALNHFRVVFSEPLLWYSSCIIMPLTTLSSFCCKTFPQGGFLWILDMLLGGITPIDWDTGSAIF